MRVSTDCFRYVKDTILKANHNPYQSTLHVKQLFPICQRYNFESKSQPKLSEEDIKINCVRYVKDTILKANHNNSLVGAAPQFTVFDMSKIQF